VLVSVTVVAGLSLFAVIAVTGRMVTRNSFERSRSDLLAAREAFRRLVETRTQFASGEVRLITELPVFREHMTKLTWHTPSMDAMTDDYCGKLGADFCIVTNASGEWIGRSGLATATRAPGLNAIVDAARQGQAVSDILSWNDRVFLAVSEPALFGSEPVGSFTAAFELNDAAASELASMARCDVTFVCADTRVCGSSLPAAERAAVVRMLHTAADAWIFEVPTRRRVGSVDYVGGRYPLGPSSSVTLLLLQDWTPTEQTLAELYQALGWVGVATFGVAIAGMLVFGRRLTRPLRDLADAADELAAGNWTKRVAVEGPAEARLMASAFNEMTVALREREDQLRQAQKMEAVGRLAGGIAHDFNNLLTGILGYADLLLRGMPPHHPMHADLEGIRKAGRSAAALTRDLLAFSRKQVLQPVVMNLNDAVIGTEHLLRRLLGEDIALELRLAADLDAVKADRAQIEQVLMNLAVNARDAMPAGGRLVVETENAAADREDVAAHLSGATGPHVLLRVRDTGQGMTAEVRAHLFEPFFTTKEVGKGTGLGLSTVYGVIKQSSGYIWADSVVGHGATFTIALPAVEAVSAPATVAQDRSDTAPRGSETVLLVEDNDTVRQLARETLTQCGYQVIEARNGQEALRIAGRQLDRISLLLTDVVMPLMGGRELASRLVGQRRELKVIYTSGYAADMLGPNAALEPGATFIQKPFTPTHLGHTVREVLDRPLS
jgi:signal transduction histidine kinase/CheY-like chemotaxis protein